MAERDSIDPPMVSVIVPVFNDSGRLRLCLQALRDQTYPADRFEVLVVDNGSSDPPRSLVESFGYTFLSEAAVGSYAARNHGLASASGQIIAFTDADCIAWPQWLAEGVEQLLAHPEVGQVTGRVDVFPADPDRPTAAELYEMVCAFPIRRYVQEQNKTATCNLLTRRSVFEAVGPFDATLKSGGDGAWTHRAATRGYPILYADAVAIRHPARRTIGQVLRKTRRLAGGIYDRRHNRAHLSAARKLRICVINLFPRVDLIARTTRDPRLQTWAQRLKVGLVVVLRQYATYGQLLRLRLLRGRSQRE